MCAINRVAPCLLTFSEKTKGKSRAFTCLLENTHNARKRACGTPAYISFAIQVIVIVVFKDYLMAIATAYHMIIRSFVFNLQLPGHRLVISFSYEIVIRGTLIPRRRLPVRGEPPA